MKFIQVLKARQNNLKGFDLFLPFYKLIVVTGISGSGKSSLVFDTLYAEGQRRYLETFSTYVRQFLERLPRPRVKDILNIPPALAFPQGNFIRTSRSTVGTLTEISNFVKMLYYQTARPYCPRCGLSPFLRDPSRMAEDILKTFPLQRVLILAPIKGEGASEYLIEGLLAEGFSRVFVKGRVCELEELSIPPLEELEVVIGRLKLEPSSKRDLVEALELALKVSDTVKVRTIYGEEKVYTTKEECPHCGLAFPKKTPALFSFNTAQGACPECKGFGNLLVVDLEALVKYPQRSLKAGAIPLLDYPVMYEVKVDLFAYLKNKGIPVDKPFFQYPEDLKRAIFHGEGSWYGFKEVVEWLSAHRYKPHFRILLAKLRREIVCPTCQGTRFNPQALLFRIKDLNIGAFYQLEIKELIPFLESLMRDQLPQAEERLVQEVLRRLNYLCQVGLSYLNLGRASKNLSGGEVSRALLTRALSSDLAETLYLIDEPTTGLHPLDTTRILQFMRQLVKRHNTVVVVEHDPEVILAGDFLVELGPEGGEGGGYLLHAGNPTAVLEINTPTSKALKELSAKKEVPRQALKYSSFITFKNCQGYNLKNIEVKIPLSSLTVIVGVSGSGKSTLLEEVIYRRLVHKKGEYTPASATEDLEVLSSDWQVYYLTQEGLSRSPRAVVATYVGIFHYVKKLLASTERAKELSLPLGYFSFNSPSAQCPNCHGLGFEVVELQFLSDLILPCEVCQGKRFKEEVLEIRWRGKNISEILDLTVEEALAFFGNHREIKKGLEILTQLGLHYLKLGQPLSTLSGGEAQRLRLAELLTRMGNERAFILLDEPTVGLHLRDVKGLLNTLNLLKDKGHTVIVVEHHPEVILAADWVIELGPEGGERGGYLLYQGPGEGLLEGDTPTGRALKRYLSEEFKFKSEEFTPTSFPLEEKKISIRGVRQHNLKNFDLDLPRGKLVVITGVSGSGKSTLAFDVLFSEGQRRFLETLPGYFRQFVKVHTEPDVDLISGLPPTVALEQRSGELSPRSTVGTLTEVLPYLRLLYSRVSQAFCPSCAKPIQPREKEELLEFAKKLAAKQPLERITLLAPLVRYRKGHFRSLFERYLRRGYRRFRVDKELRELPPIPELSRYREHSIDLVLGRPKEARHFLSLVELGLEEGKGEVILSTEEGDYYLSTKRTCATCGISLPEPIPLFFAFNTKVGACPTCEGLGRLDEKTCPVCQGTRLRKETRYYKIGGLSLPELCDLPIERVLEFLKILKFEGREREIAQELLQEICGRLQCLIDLGLSYLTLSRSADTLSSGEAKRVRISAEIGSNLTGVAYILDEPTIGLHPRDTKRLLTKLGALCQKGNSVFVVEHDEETILASDYVVDLGRGGGKRGGEVLFAGEKEDFIRSTSVTALALKDRNRRSLFSQRRVAEKFLELKGLTLRNLKRFEVKFPIGLLVAVVGVSGSGKSTLVCEALYRSLEALLKGKKPPFWIRELKGWEEFSEVYLVDHSPIGNTPRSVPATYINVFSEIRKIFASSLSAKERGYREGRFSFNNPEGQCPHCRGQGKTKVEIPFLPVIYQTCEYCRGKRYNQETLGIQVKGKSIAEVLEMDFAEAKEFFHVYSGLQRKLDFVCQIGLDYLLLGQPSPTLSGGEAQRIKLAKELSKSQTKSVLYLLDEPTTGLHINDTSKLALVFQELVSRGHTVIFIEHNLELVKYADWIVELGPEGGERGGELLFSGPIEDFLQLDTETAKCLKNYLLY